MLKMLNVAKEWLLDILLPKFCVGCGREGVYICKDCEVFLSEVDPILGGPTSDKSWTSDVQLDIGCPTPDIVSVWEYEGLMEKLIYKIKFDGCCHIIDELVEKAMARVELNLPADTYITYVPMYKKRERKRGFNQAELIAKKIGEITEQPVAGLLEKTKDNRSQVGLGPKEREENVKDVFRPLKLSFNELAETKFQRNMLENVLLIDDVYTTGATVKECVRVLKRAGVKNVLVFTLARKLRI